MRVIVQRSKKASVTIDGIINGRIDKGFVLLVGFTDSDTFLTIDKIVKKIINLRVFSDDAGKMNLNILNVNGSILSISQFTLYADCKGGNRPSFTKSAKFDQALILYDYFNAELSKHLTVEKGIFGADMLVSLENDGPVTITLDSEICV